MVLRQRKIGPVGCNAAGRIIIRKKRQAATRLNATGRLAFGTHKKRWFWLRAIRDPDARLMFLIGPARLMDIEDDGCTLFGVLSAGRSEATWGRRKGSTTSPDCQVRMACTAPVRGELASKFE